MQRTPIEGSRAARKAAKKEKGRSEKSPDDEDSNIPSAPTETILIQGEPTAVVVSAAAQGSSMEGSVRSNGLLPNLAPPMPWFTDSKAFNTPLLSAYDVSVFRSSRSSAYRSSSDTRLASTSTECSLRKEPKEEAKSKILVELQGARAGEREQVGAATPFILLNPGAPLARKVHVLKQASDARTTKNPTVDAIPPLPPNDRRDSSPSEGGSLPFSESSEDYSERRMAALPPQGDSSCARELQGASPRPRPCFHRAGDRPISAGSGLEGDCKPPPNPRDPQCHVWGRGYTPTGLGFRT